MLGNVLVRSIFFALGTALATCHAPAGTPAPVPLPPAPPPEEASTPPRFDPDVVRADETDPVTRTRLALRSGEAGVAWAYAQVRATTPLSGGRLAWLGARARLALGDPQGAVDALGPLAEGDHPLAPYARLERARALVELDAARAATEAAPLAELDWPARSEAREVRALALAAAGDDAAEAALRELLAEPTSSARSTIAIPLAELLAAREDEQARVEAITLLRRVIVRAPLSRAAAQAEERVTALLATLPPARRRPLAQLGVEDAIARAEALDAAMEHGQAEQAFAQAADRTQDGALRCRALYGRGKALYFGRERSRAAALLAEVARDCADPEIKAWSRYYAGRGYVSAGELDRALAQFEQLERDVPAHRLADDARLRAALIDAERGNEQSMSDRLTSLPERYPEGDMRGEARFLLAWRARAGGRLDDALAHIDASLREGTGESAEDVRGRAAYWRACVLSELGRDDDARDAWMALARERPLSYYAQQAMARLRERSPASAELVRESLGRRGAPRLAFDWRDALDTPGFARALELLRVGELARAQRELDAVLGAGEDERWIAAALYDRVEAYPQSIALARRLRDFMDRAPSGEHFARWRVAYPRAYAPLIDDVARERGLPAAFVRAIAREESSFRADAVSVANAYGLTQLIVPTARRFGQPLGLTASPQSLIEPDTNVRIGTAFMAWLWARYPTNPAVIPSAYNAGQGATDRWLRERPRQRLDVWVEEIPFDETRRYTRRVIQSWGVYGWLDGGELMALEAGLPATP
ncbi:MAG: lytic transglycosylase domain-containing protein [Sandaracinaceae bacterium]|nr:lytic transglycosylase domain-containing protein [Sandaracinaceae bacterium]